MMKKVLPVLLILLTAAFLAGQKNAKETAEMIQDRATLVVFEQS